MKYLLTIFLFLTSITFFRAEEVHPYHVGSVEFNYNAKTKTFEISGKFFTDDLENAINKKFGTSVFFHNKKVETQMNALLEKYLSEYVKLKVNNTLVKINYIGFEEDRESVNLYLESEPIAEPTKVETAVSMLYNLFSDQMNIIHIVVSGKRQSHKLSFPDRYLYKNF